MRPIYTVFLISAALSLGAPITYSSLSSWESAAGGSSNTLGLVNFDTAPTGSDSYVLSSFVFSTIADSNALTRYSSPQAFGTLGNGTFIGANTSNGWIRIAIPNGIYGLSFLVGSNNQSNGNLASPVTILVNNTHSFTVATTAMLQNPATFWGIRDDAPLTSIRISAAPGNFVFIDSVRWQSVPQEPPPPPPTETPEAATAILIGSALLMLPALRRRFAVSSAPSSSPTPQHFAH